MTEFYIYALIFRLAIIAAGIVSIVLGYKLFVKGVFGGPSDTELEANVGGSKFTLKNAAPGTFFALFGVILISVMLMQGMPQYESTTRRIDSSERSSKPTPEPEDMENLESPDEMEEEKTGGPVGEIEEVKSLENEVNRLMNNEKKLHKELLDMKGGGVELEAKIAALEAREKSYLEELVRVRSETSQSLETKIKEAFDFARRGFYEKAVNKIKSHRLVANAMNTLAHSYNKLNKPIDAVCASTLAVNFEGQNHLYIRTHAYSLKLNGDNEEALVMIKRAADLNESNRPLISEFQ